MKINSLIFTCCTILLAALHFGDLRATLAEPPQTSDQFVKGLNFEENVLEPNSNSVPTIRLSIGQPYFNFHIKTTEARVPSDFFCVAAANYGYGVKPMSYEFNPLVFVVCAGITCQKKYFPLFFHSHIPGISANAFEPGKPISFYFHVECGRREIPNDVRMEWNFEVIVEVTSIVFFYPAEVLQNRKWNSVMASFEQGLGYVETIVQSIPLIQRNTQETLFEVLVLGYPIDNPETFTSVPVKLKPNSFDKVKNGLTTSGYYEPRSINELWETFPSDLDEVLDFKTAQKLWADYLKENHPAIFSSPPEINPLNFEPPIVDLQDSYIPNGENDINLDSSVTLKTPAKQLLVNDISVDPHSEGRAILFELVLEKPEINFYFPSFADEELEKDFICVAASDSALAAVRDFGSTPPLPFFLCNGGRCQKRMSAVFFKNQIPNVNAFLVAQPLIFQFHVTCGRKAGVINDPVLTHWIFDVQVMVTKNVEFYDENALTTSIWTEVVEVSSEESIDYIDFIVTAFPATGLPKDTLFAVFTEKRTDLKGRDRILSFPIHLKKDAFRYGPQIDGHPSPLPTRNNEFWHAIGDNIEKALDFDDTENDIKHFLLSFETLPPGPESVDQSNTGSESPERILSFTSSTDDQNRRDASVSSSSDQHQGNDFSSSSSPDQHQGNDFSSSSSSDQERSDVFRLSFSCIPQGRRYATGRASVSAAGLHPFQHCQAPGTVPVVPMVVHHQVMCSRTSRVNHCDMRSSEKEMSRGISNVKSPSTEVKSNASHLAVHLFSLIAVMLLLW